MSLLSQFARIPRPTQSFDGQVVLVTGANTGLGFEAARHFVQLGAAKVILACRNVEAGTASAVDISRTTGRDDACEVWQVDLGDFASVRRLVERAASLKRLDAVVANAAVAKISFTRTGSMETTVAVNVVGTFLLALGLLPLLKRSAAAAGTAGHLVVVTSDVHRW
jgi:retinol dehydrogenase 12